MPSLCQHITNDLYTEESEGYMQFLHALGIQLNINMDPDHEDFKEDEQEVEEEEEEPLSKIPLLKSKMSLRNPNKEMVPSKYR